ncbi:STAS domain-containing protein [Gracilinema caldarium]|uniref:Sulfate transporter/antisigma-factor antagonist STAS n=1 Tax=Gracilinema caldarium (strain ATCC 51460 / DSM 7334 / H1) TaxID=744872 RepID=F8F087_GRAC1|nr:STAS domain-containing protein [Gracilinema caldarium]AEJ18951.1 Sulfate transporter/antisigma-factor antagonist STAS [Gracilinema caldarium DSM 7334]
MTKQQQTSINDLTINLEWKGSLSIEHARGLHQDLLEAFTKHQTIYLDLSNVTDMDSSIIQLICAAIKEAPTQKKAFHLTGTLQTLLQTKLKRYGFIMKETSIAEELEKQWSMQNQGSL